MKDNNEKSSESSFSSRIYVSGRYNNIVKLCQHGLYYYFILIISTVVTAICLSLHV